LLHLFFFPSLAFPYRSSQERAVSIPRIHPTPRVRFSSQMVPFSSSADGFPQAPRLLLRTFYSYHPTSLILFFPPWHCPERPKTCLSLKGPGHIPPKVLGPTPSPPLQAFRELPRRTSEQNLPFLGGGVFFGLQACVFPGSLPPFPIKFFSFFFFFAFGTNFALFFRMDPVCFGPGKFAHPRQTFFARRFSFPSTALFRVFVPFLLLKR